MVEEGNIKPDVGSPSLEPTTAGPIVLLGSGETSPSGRKVFEVLLSSLPAGSQVSILETPAGFELNSNLVAGRVADFINISLQNYRPKVQVIPARKRGSQFSPDDPEIVAPIYESDVIFMGPGSPTYAVRQLEDSLAWQAVQARHRMGAALVFASAAVIAVSAYALPVYEIYKVGEDLHWKAGLNFLSSYGLPLVFIPHWNNQEGGAALDTSRCFVGQSRFSQMMKILPPGLTVVGVDEKTALIIDVQAGVCRALGPGAITLIHTGPEHPGSASAGELAGSGLDEVARLRQGHVHKFYSGEEFPLAKLGQFAPPVGGEGLPSEVWAHAQEAQARKQAAPVVPPEVQALVEERQAARASKDWARADALRDEIAALGWQVMDTRDGVQLQPASD